MSIIILFFLLKKKKKTKLIFLNFNYIKISNFRININNCIDIKNNFGTKSNYIGPKIFQFLYYYKFKGGTPSNKKKLMKTNIQNDRQSH